MERVALDGAVTSVRVSIILDINSFKECLIT